MHACMYLCMCTVCAWYLWGTEEGVTFPGASVIDSCEPSYGCWEPSLGSLKKSSSALNHAAISPAPWKLNRASFQKTE